MTLLSLAFYYYLVLNNTHTALDQEMIDIKLYFLVCSSTFSPFFSAWRLYNVSLDTLFDNHCKGKGVTNTYQKWNSKVFALFPVKYELQQSGCTVPRIV